MFVSIVLNAPRFFRITIISSTDDDDAQSNITWPDRYAFNYTSLAKNFFFKV